MAMMNYQMPPSYPHSMHNYMDYSMHNPHIHNPLTMHPVQNHHFHTNPQIPNPNMNFIPDDFYVDDSDDESNLTSEDYEDDRMSDELFEREPSAVDQLLDFAQTASTDLQKFFGKKRVLDEPELIADCNKKVRLSGRELYYADLLRVAQHGDSADPCKEVPEPNRIIRYGDNESSQELTSNLSPKSIDSSGLGPLEELFNYAEKNTCYNHSHMLPMFGYSTSNGAWMPSTDNINDTTSLGGKASLTPWRKRAMPKSFFTEPTSSPVPHIDVDQRFVALSLPLEVPCVGSASSQHEAPDFSELMATMEFDDDHGLPRVTPVHG